MTSDGWVGLDSVNGDSEKLTCFYCVNTAENGSMRRDGEIRFSSEHNWPTPVDSMISSKAAALIIVNICIRSASGDTREQSHPCCSASWRL